MLSAREVRYRGKIILVIDVPVSSLVHKCGDTVYARNEDGDYKVTRPEAIAAMVNRKQSYFTEQRVYPYLTLDDFDPRLFDRAKRLIQGRSPGHPWVELTTEELLHRASFYRKSPDGKHGYTLAAALFFGTDETIQSIVPAYKIDALVRRRDLDRYDDRLTVRTNLIDAYDLLMGFIAKHLDDPFYLEGDVRISLRDKIFRELVSNIIAHREYLDGRPATMIIYRDKVVFSNPNIPREKGIIDPSRFTPFPKNPTISKFMIQLGRVEEVGSGIRNVTKYLPLYADGGKSEFIEDELFVTNVQLKIQEERPTQVTTQENIEKVLQWVKENDLQGIRSLLNKELGEGWEKTEEKLGEKLKRVGRKAKKELGETQLKIMGLILMDKNITTQKLSEILEISTTAVEKNIARLKSRGLLERIGPDKGGYWSIQDK